MRLKFLSTKSDLPAIESIWKDLAAPGVPSYFLSWGWMETWVRSLPADLDLRLAVFEEGGEPLVAGFLGHGKVTRRKIFGSTAYLLNETGNRKYDQVYIEYNAFLTRPNTAPKIQEIARLLPDDWDEICFSGVSPDRFPGCAIDQPVPGCHWNVTNRIPCPYVELEAIAAKKGDFLALVSSNARSQIRRSYKLYEQRAKLETKVAGNVEEALAYYGEMKELHARAWQRKGDQGAFANPWFDHFHQTLIRNRFEHGEIQLVRVACGARPVGVIYNLVWDKVAYYYQAGLEFEEDNRMKPGYVAHTEAIQYNFRAGNRRYDFMAGPEDFKSRLSTHSTELIWARLQKPRLKFAVENLSRTAAIEAVKRYKEWKRRRPFASAASAVSRWTGRTRMPQIAGQ